MPSSSSTSAPLRSAATAIKASPLLLLFGGIAVLAAAGFWTVSVNTAVPASGASPRAIPAIAVNVSPQTGFASAMTLGSDKPQGSAINIVREENGVLIDASVDEAELAERFDDPYEFNEAVGPSQQPELDHSGGEFIQTAAEEDTTTASNDE